MSRTLTILILVLTAGVFVSCGADGETVDGGLTAGGREVGGGGLESSEHSEDGGGGRAGGGDGIQRVETSGKIFSLQDMVLDVHQWLPQILETDQEDYGAEGRAKKQVADLFRPECHMYNQVNVCPEGAEIVFENKFTLQSVIGLIDHAGMYSSNIFKEGNNFFHSYKNCGAGYNSAELLDHTAVFDPPDSDRFLVDFYDLFDCVATFAHSTEVPSYALYSKSVNGKIFASLFARKQHKGTEWYTGIMSDLFQSYIKADTDGNLQLLASNIASFDEKNTGDWGQGSFVIANMQTKKLAAKTVDIQGRGIVLLGGVGEDEEGYYMVKAGSDDDGAYNFCVRGYAEEASFADNSECNNLDGMSRFFLPDNWSARELYAWLGMNADDIKDLSGFDSFFSNSNFLSANLAPQSGADYFPDSISK